MLSPTFREHHPVTIASITATLLKTPVSNYLTCINAVLNRTSIREALHRIQANAVVLIGDEDLAEPPAHSKVLTELIPNSVFTEVSNAGHLIPIEQPQFIIDALCSIQ
jgi:3-oxoadipate enol-lactonase